MDLFKWSVPFLMEKIGDMMEHLMKKSRAADIATETEAADVQAILQEQQSEQVNEAKEAEAAKRRRREVLKQKIRFVGRMSRMLKTIRSNADEIRQIKEQRPDHKLPVGVLVGGSQQLHDMVAKFHQTRISDSHNDKMPTNSRRLSMRTKALLQSSQGAAQ